MLRSLLGCLLVLAVVCGALGQAPDLAKDERLAKPITVRRALIPLSEATQLLSEEIGVTVEAASSLRDLKCTILVTGEPAHRVLKGLGEALDLEWTADGSLLRLVQDSAKADEVRSYLRDEEALRRKGPEAALRAQAADANLAWPVAKRQKPELTPERYLLAQLARRALGSVWSGATFFAYAPVDDLEGNEPGPDATAAKPAFVALRYNPIDGALENSLEPKGRRRAPTVTPELAPALREHPLQKRIAAWNLIEPVTHRLKEVPDMKASAPLGTLASLLEGLHAATGIPIVADALRSRGYPCRLVEDMLIVRHRDYWRLRLDEISERTLRPLESGEPSLEKYAAFAAALTPRQALLFASSDVPVLRVKTDPLESAMPFLKFYGGLGRLQSIAQRGRPIQLAELNATQKALFKTALEGVLDGGQLDADVLKADPREYAFWLMPLVAGRGALSARFGTQRVGTTYLLQIEPDVP
jgi:hypothetical protein